MYGRGLKGKPLNVIGVIVGHHWNPTYSRVISVLEREAGKRGYNILLCYSNESWENEKNYITILLQKGVSGILVIPSGDCTKTGNRYAPFEGLDVPIVFIYRSFPDCVFDVVKTDNVYGAKMATEYLFQKGHRNIVHLTTGQNNSSVLERIEGFRVAHLKAKLPIPEERIYRLGEIDKESCSYAVDELLKSSGKDFSAIFTYNDYAAYWVMKSLLKRGIRIPEDIAVMGYDNNTFDDICLVPLTTVPLDAERISKVGIELLIRRIENPLAKRREVIFKPLQIVERESV